MSSDGSGMGSVGADDEYGYQASVDSGLGGVAVSFRGSRRAGRVGVESVARGSRMLAVMRGARMQLKTGLGRGDMGAI